MTEPEPRRQSLRGPELLGLLLIGVGVLFLVDRFTPFRFGWGAIWPLIIVGLGVLILTGAIGRRPAGGSPGQTSVRVPRDGTDQLELELRLGAGRYTVRGGAVELIEAESRAPDLAVTTTRDGRRARVRLAHDRPWLPFSEHDAIDWQVAVGADLPTRLDIAAGAGDFTIDLSEIRVVDARLSIGAAQAVVTLPRPIGEVPIRISTGASQVTIVTPPDVEMQVRAAGGLLSLEGRNETPGYATAVDRVAVRVDGGAASIRIS
jgi:hypothetical protein